MEGESSEQQALYNATEELLAVCSTKKNTELIVTKVVHLLSVAKQLSKRCADNSDAAVISRKLLKCLRLLLVDTERSIRVQSCRAMRYVTCHLAALQEMQQLNIPVFMMICLEREAEDNKFLWERMQSLKWVRHLVDYFAAHIPQCVIMSLIAIAQNGKDEFRRISIDTLREICISNPRVINECNGFKILIDSILTPHLCDISNSLVLTILYILDHPNTRKYLRPSHDIQRLLSPFVDIDPYKEDALSEAELREKKQVRAIAQKTLMTMLKSITGIFYLGGHHENDAGAKAPLKMLVDLMRLSNNIAGIQWARKMMFSVLENALLPLSDSHTLDRQRGPNLIVNYVCLILMAFIQNGLIECLVDVGMRSDMELAPRARTLLQRIQFLAAKYLPSELTSQICDIRKVMNDATKFHDDELDINSLIRKRKIQHRCTHCHCELHHLTAFKLQQRQGLGLYKSNLQITVQRNFANMMISELTEDAPLDMDNEDDHGGGGGGHQSHAHGDGDEEEEEDEMMGTMNDDEDEDAVPDEEDDGDEDGDNDAGNDDDEMDDKPKHSSSKRGQPFISAQTICHRLGIEFDLNSTLIRYRTMMDRDIPSMLFQDRIPYHCHRVDPLTMDGNNFEAFSFVHQKRNILESLKFDQNASYSESLLMSMLKKTQVILTKDFMLWNMDHVWKVLNGPLWSEHNLNVALNKTKFVKRLVQYLKPSRQFFSQLKWHHSTIRHAQCACQLFRLLLSSDDACKNVYFQELIAEIFDSLKDQIDANLRGKKASLAHTPFSRSSVRFTLSRVYLVLIGILSESPRGLHFFTVHQMQAFLFPLTRKEIYEQQQSKERRLGSNDYLLRLLATNLDYTVCDDFRMLFSQWMASGSLFLRKSLIGHLDLLYRAQMARFDEWSMNVLAVLLKDHEQRLALTALKVLEKINLSQSMKNDAKSTQYLVDLISHQPNDSHIGVYGQFLFIKMLSTEQGFHFLHSTQWLQRKREEWMRIYHHRYTEMLETALVHSVSSTMPSSQSNFDDAVDDSLAATATAGSASTFIPYHLLHEHRNDEDQLHAEYLTQFPWALSVSIKKASGVQETVDTDAFYDFNAFYYKSRDEYPLSLGPGIQAILLDKLGRSKPLLITKDSKIEIRLNIGHETLDDLYSAKHSLSKTVTMRNVQSFGACSIIRDDPCIFIFGGDENKRCLTRIFWSMSEKTAKSSHLSLVRPLPHYYGELCKTVIGCSFIRDNPDTFLRDVQHFIEIVRLALDNSQINSTSNHLELRSCLWALGMIGSSQCGLRLLYEQHATIVDDVCVLTLSSQTLSIRGTCLYVLGLLSRTKTGMHSLTKHGFRFPADNFPLDLAVALPTDIDAFFNLGKCPYVSAQHLRNVAISCYSPPQLCRPGKTQDLNEILGQQGHTEQTILAHISSLSNRVTQLSSHKALQRLRSKKPSVFSNPLLFRETLKLLNTYQFKLAAKRFILFDLFNNVIFKYEHRSLQQPPPIDLFDEDLRAPLLPFTQIREWRYNHKQMLIEKKQKKQQQRLMRQQEQLQQQTIEEDKQKEFDMEEGPPNRKIARHSEAYVGTRTGQYKPLPPKNGPELIRSQTASQFATAAGGHPHRGPGKLTRVQRAAAKYEDKQKNRTISVGSPTKQMNGPNPLNQESSINENGSMT